MAAPRASSDQLQRDVHRLHADVLRVKEVLRHLLRLLKKGVPTQRQYRNGFNRDFYVAVERRASMSPTEMIHYLESLERRMVTPARRVASVDALPQLVVSRREKHAINDAIRLAQIRCVLQEKYGLGGEQALGQLHSLSEGSHTQDGKSLLDGLDASLRDGDGDNEADD